MGFIAAMAAAAAALAAVEPSLDESGLPGIRSAIQRAIDQKQTPGAVFWIERAGTALHFALGHRALVPTREAMTEDTVFDAASLTKVVATATSIMILVEQNRIRLDAPVRAYLPEFRGEGRESVTVKQLLTHVSGLKPALPRDPARAGQLQSSPPNGRAPYAWSGYDAAIRIACDLPLETPPDAAFRYSDVNFILLGEMVRRISGAPLDAFAAKHIFAPLKMSSTTFKPPGSWKSRIAPTEKDDDGTLLRGVVHDPAARRMGGVAGHAGMFTTAGDLARFARMILNAGDLNGVRILKPETVELMTRVQTPPTVSERRGLGWDIESSYSRPRGWSPDRTDDRDGFPVGSFGHTGFTGASLWIDAFSKTFVIFLSTRLHPDGRGDVRDLYSDLGSLAVRTVRDFDFKNVPGALSSRLGKGQVPAVLNGIDVLRMRNFAPLAGLRVGLVTNHTGHDGRRDATIDLLARAPNVKLAALFSPEHGIRGQFDQAKIADSKDAKTGLPVYSLYGERKAPSPEQLRSLDALVFDIQDIGCRFYTYISTMQFAMEAAAREGKKFIVLDRVNPIGGTVLEGPVQLDKESFVACHPIPLRHGMTVGELAMLMNQQRGIEADLTVVRCEGWTRDLWFDQTGLPWTIPSPNMRSLTAAALYPGVGLLESAVSVGRGTDKPFEYVGAPYIDELRFAHEMNRAGLAGVRFVPVRFTPSASVFKGKPCGGVEILITDRNKLKAVDVGIALACMLQKLHPQQFAAGGMDRLLVDAKALAAIKGGREWKEIVAMWKTHLDVFKRRRQVFLLYP